MKRRNVLGIISVCSAISCASVYTNPVVEYHMINIDRDGKYTPSPPHVRLDQRGGEDELTVFQGFLADLFKRVKHSPAEPGTGRTHLVIYVHGGLTMYYNAIKHAVERHRAITQDGLYPIFINWRSFFFTTYSEHLGRIRQGQRVPVAWVTSPLYLLTDLASAVVRGPRSLLIQGHHLVNTVTEAGSWLGDRLGMREPGGGDTNPEAAYILYMDGRQAVRRERLLGVIWDIATVPGMLLLNPLVSELGRPSWDIMRRRDQTLFRRPSDFEESECARFPGNGLAGEPYARCHEGTGALALFIQELERFLTAHGGSAQDNGTCRVTLIGHSMGAIVVNQILGEFPHVHFDHVVFMGAAVSTNEVLDHTIPYLQRHPTTQFYSLMLAPDNENRESSLIGVEPSGSLLVWIDNYYTTPLTQLDRTFGRWENVRAALHVFPRDVLERQMHFKIFGFDKTNSPQEHGDFGRFSFWRPNFWWAGPWQYGGSSKEAP